MTMDLIINICVILFFIVMGFIFRAGKAYFLIAGYNTASKAEKEKIDPKKLSKYVGNLCLIFACCAALAFLGERLRNPRLVNMGFFAFIAAAAGGIIYINTGNRIKK